MPLRRQVPDSLIPHKTFTGNRPSTSILLPDLSAYTTGQTLAIYENVTAAMVRALEPANLCNPGVRSSEQGCCSQHVQVRCSSAAA